MPEGCRVISIAHAFAARNENEISRAALEGVDGDSLEDAMDMVAERVWESRKRTFVHEQDGVSINHTTAVCHLGGATLDNEENYLIKKLFTGGLGMVCVSNQARI